MFIAYFAGRDAVFTVNFKQLLHEKISIRIVDPRGAIVPHRETEIQTGISRYSICVMRHAWLYHIIIIEMARDM